MVINKTNLYIHNSVKLLRYMLLITLFVFGILFVGSFRVKGVNCPVANVNDSNHASVHCYDSATYTYLNSEGISIPMYVDGAYKWGLLHSYEWTMGKQLYFRICEYGGRSNCKTFNLLNETAFDGNNVVKAIHLKMYRNGSVNWNYINNSGSWVGWKTYSSSEYSSFLSSTYPGSKYQKNGFRLEVYGRFYEAHYSSIEIGGLYWINEYAYAGWDVPAYYLGGAISLEVDTNEYAKSHVVTGKIGSYDSITSVTYAVTNSSSTPSSYNYTYSGSDKENISITVSSGSGSKYLHVRAITSENKYIRSKISIKMDNSGPTLSSANSNFSGDTTWKQSVDSQVKVQFLDSGSGVSGASYKYCWTTSSSGCDPNLGNVMTVTANSSGEANIPYPDGETGEFYLSVRGYDKLENVSSIYTSSGAYYVDNAAPTLKTTLSGSASHRSKNSYIQINFEDDGIGTMGTVKYCWSLTTSCNPTTIVDPVNGRYRVNYDDGSGKFYLSVVATDSLGNESAVYSSSSWYATDNDGPTKQGFLGGNATPGLPSNGGTGSMTSTIKFKDNEGGVGGLTYYYCWYKSSTTKCTIPSSGGISDSAGNGVQILYPDVSVVGNDKGSFILRVQVKDSLGNASAIEETGGYYIDGTTPAGGISSYSKGKNKEHWAKIEFDEAQSIYYCWYKDETTACDPTVSKAIIANGGTVNKSDSSSGVEELWWLVVVAENQAGAVSAQQKVSFWFDRKAPTFTYSYGVKPSSIVQIEDSVVMMSITSEDIEMYEDVPEENDELNEKTLIYVDDNDEVEVIDTNGVLFVIESTEEVSIDFLAYALRNGLYITCGYCFINDRRRIKFS